MNFPAQVSLKIPNSTVIDSFFYVGTSKTYKFLPNTQAQTLIAPLKYNRFRHNWLLSEALLRRWMHVAIATSSILDICSIWFFTIHFDQLNKVNERENKKTHKHTVGKNVICHTIWMSNPEQWANNKINKIIYTRWMHWMWPVYITIQWAKMETNNIEELLLLKRNGDKYSGESFALVFIVWFNTISKLKNRIFRFEMRRKNKKKKNKIKLLNLIEWNEYGLAIVKLEYLCLESGRRSHSMWIANKTNFYQFDVSKFHLLIGNYSTVREN